MRRSPVEGSGLRKVAAMPAPLAITTCGAPTRGLAMSMRSSRSRLQEVGITGKSPISHGMARNRVTPICQTTACGEGRLARKSQSVISATVTRSKRRENLVSPVSAVSTAVVLTEGPKVTEATGFSVLTSSLLGATPICRRSQARLFKVSVAAATLLLAVSQMRAKRLAKRGKRERLRGRSPGRPTPCRPKIEGVVGGAGLEASALTMTIVEAAIVATTRGLAETVRRVTVAKRRVIRPAIKSRFTSSRVAVAVPLAV